MDGGKYRIHTKATESMRHFLYHMKDTKERRICNEPSVIRGVQSPPPQNRKIVLY